MKSGISLLVAGACVALLSIGTLIPADDTRVAGVPAAKGVKLENVTWRNLWYIKFKPGQSERGLALWERFEKAWQKAQMPPATRLRMQSGRWSLITIFTLSEGVHSLEWMKDPLSAKFDQALAEQEGGPEKAEALFQEFNDCVMDEESELAFEPKS